MRVLLVLMSSILFCGCMTANFALNYNDAARLPEQEVHNIVVVTEGGYTTSFLKALTPYIANAFQYRGYQCTGVYFDSSSFAQPADIARKVDSLNPQLVVTLYAVADIFSHGKHGDYHTGNVYRVDVSSRAHNTAQPVAKGTASLNYEAAATEADYKRVAENLCTELLQHCVIHPLKGT